MSNMKTCVVLLALMLAAMAIVPIVSAADEINSRSDYLTSNQVIHQIPDNYLKDTKPAEWLPESDMVSFIIPQKTLNTFGQDSTSGLIQIPVTYLDRTSNFFERENVQNMYVERDITKDETIVLLHMPMELYETFMKTNKGEMLTLPSAYFFRSYKNLDDLYTHIVRDGESVQYLPSEVSSDEKTLSALTISHSRAPDPEQKAILSAISLPILLDDPPLYAQWAGSYRISSTNYDYCIGQIQPSSWTLTGTGTDLFKIFHEREYKFDSNEAIEIVAQYFDRNEGAGIYIYPALYRSGAQYPINTWDWNYWGGYIPLSSNSIPHAYGYHVGFANGYYTITFEDMNTLQWLAQSQVSAASGTSSFTKLDTSSEYRQLNTPSSDTFSATTNPIIEEWARTANGGWNKPLYVWQTPTKTADVDYVSVNSQWDSGGNLVSQSYADYP